MWIVWGGGCAGVGGGGEKAKAGMDVMMVDGSVGDRTRLARRVLGVFGVSGPRTGMMIGHEGMY